MIRLKNRTWILVILLAVVGCAPVSYGHRDGIYYRTTTVYREAHSDSVSINSRKEPKMNYKRFTKGEKEILMEALQIYTDDYNAHMDNLVDMVNAPTAEQEAEVKKRYEDVRDLRRSEISVIKRKVITLTK